MNVKLSFLLFFLFLSLLSYSQTYKGQLIDSVSKKPIPFATIQLDKTTGVITNDEGFFNLYTQEYTTKTVTISCLGYQEKTLTLNQLNSDTPITLSEAVNELDTVFISGDNLSADSILFYVNQNIEKNYSYFLKNHYFFSRNASTMSPKELAFEIEKATGYNKKTLTKVNEQLDSLAYLVKTSNIVQYTDFVGNLLTAKDSSKIEVKKATVLVDKKRDFSVDNMSEKAVSVILKYLDTTKTYKVKSGLFKLEDSLSFAKELKEEKERLAKNERYTSSFKWQASTAIWKAYPIKNKHFLDPELYTYEVTDITYFANDIAYIVTFSPKKAKAKYAGTMYISSSDYAILRVDYKYAEGKHGQKVNLKLILGVKFEETESSGTTLFSKHTNGYYYPKYVSNKTSQYIYMHRPLKFKENGTKNKIDIDILLEGNFKEETQYLALEEPTEIDQNLFDEFKEEKKTKYIPLKSYIPSIWKEYNTIEPVAEMKQFKSVE